MKSDGKKVGIWGLTPLLWCHCDRGKLGIRYRGLFKIFSDGKELPEDLRQKTDLQLGMLTVLSVQKGVDSGSYTCIANNKHGHSAKRTTTVDVIGKVFCTSPKVLSYIGSKIRMVSKIKEISKRILESWRNEIVAQDL